MGEPVIQERTAQHYAAIPMTVTMAGLAGAADEGFPSCSAGWPGTRPVASRSCGDAANKLAIAGRPYPDGPFGPGGVPRGRPPVPPMAGRPGPRWQYARPAPLRANLRTANRASCGVDSGPSRHVSTGVVR